MEIFKELWIRHHGVTKSLWMRFDGRDAIDGPSGERADCPGF